MGFRLFLLFLLGALAARVAGAGPSPPCVGAVSSGSGQFLVRTNVHLEPEPTGPAYRATRGTLDIFERVRSKSRGDFASADTYWYSTPQWSIDLEDTGRGVNACPLSLISDDGAFLILLNDTSEFDPGLKIYRRGEHFVGPTLQGVFVRTVNWRELWPAGKLPEHLRTGETPPWYEGTAFAFSPDSQVLIHRTRWGNMVHIRLGDGVVLKD